MPGNLALPPLRSADLSTGRVAWRETGRGAALVLVHGIGGYSASWRPQLAALGDEFRVIAWDAPGYGGSAPLSASDPRADDYAAALLALLDHLEVRSAHFVGHSLGALFLAALCRQRGSIAERMVFLHPVTGSGGMAAEQREALRAARIADLKAMSSRTYAENRGRVILGSVASLAAVREAIEVMAAVPEAGYLAAWDAMCAGDIFGDLGHVRCPVLVVSGSEDPVSPPATGETIVARLAVAQIRVIERLGHYGLLEAPDLINSMLTQFCAQGAQSGEL